MKKLDPDVYEKEDLIHAINNLIQEHNEYTCKHKQCARKETDHFYIGNEKINMGYNEC